MNNQQKKVIRGIIASLVNEKENLNIEIEQINTQRSELLITKEKHIARKEEINASIEVLRQGLE